MWRWMAIGIMGASLFAPAVQAQSERVERWQIVAERGDREANERRRAERGEPREGRRRYERGRPEREMLSPDEHRELNRDLQRANREIYRRGRDR